MVALDCRFLLHIESLHNAGSHGTSMLADLCGLQLLNEIRVERCAAPAAWLLCHDVAGQTGITCFFIPPRCSVHSSDAPENPSDFFSGPNP